MKKYIFNDLRVAEVNGNLKSFRKIVKKLDSSYEVDFCKKWFTTEITITKDGLEWFYTFFN